MSIPASSGERNKKLAVSLFAIVVGMLMLSFAAVPLYNMFCKVTGYGGQAKRAEQAPANIHAREFIVRFNTDIDKNLPWHFVPDVSEVRVRLGEEKLVSFTAENKSDKPVTGNAVYNVAPDSVGAYFNKIECFCFKEQLLKPHEKIHMPVSFFIDESIEKDPNFDNLKTVTLSYTFFLSKNQQP